MYRGDKRAGEIVDFLFTTSVNGVPTQLAGTPAVRVYKSNGTTEDDSGITLTVDFDSKTGLNHVRIDTSADGVFYADGSDFMVVISAGTVGGQSVIGHVIAEFSLENRSALRATVAGRELNVAADGDLAGNVDGSVASVTGAVGSVTGAVGSVTGNVGGNVTGSVGSLAVQAKADVNAEADTAIADAALATAANLATVDTVVDAILADTGTDGVVVAAASKTGYTLSAAGIQAIWDALTSALTTVGSIGKLLVDNINATISSRLASASYTAPLDAAGVRSAVGLASADLDTQLAALPTAAENADAVWDEATAGHQTAGTTGKALTDAGAAGTPPTAAEIADAVWDEATAGHVTSGTTGAALGAAGSAGDPWETSLPGAYGAGTAGKIIGDNLNATVGSRATQTSVDTIDDFLDTEIAAIKAKTDNLPTDPADQSAVEAAITAATSPLATAADLAAVAGYVDTEVAAIKAKTDLIPASPAATGDIPSAATVASQVRTELTTELARVDAAVSSRATPAQVNAEVLDVLAVDTFAEPASVPAATATIKDKLGWVALLARNQVTQTATTQAVRNDADSANVATAAVSDDGTTFTRGEWG